LAAKDSSVTIDQDFYARWGDFENQDFSTWWSAHWRDLFAIDIGVYELTDLKRKVAKSDEEIIIRIPLSQNIRRSLEQVRDLLKQHNASDRLRDMSEGQFRLTAGNNDQGELIHPSARMLRNLGKLRLLFHVYRFWVANDGMVFRKRSIAHQEHSSIGQMLGILRSRRKRTIKDQKSICRRHFDIM